MMVCIIITNKGENIMTKKFNFIVNAGAPLPIASGITLNLDKGFKDVMKEIPNPDEVTIRIGNKIKSIAYANDVNIVEYLLKYYKYRFRNVKVVVEPMVYSKSYTEDFMVSVEVVKYESVCLGTSPRASFLNYNMFYNNEFAKNAIARCISFPVVERVIFNDPATIVFWSDGTKTVVKAQNEEPFDPEKGLAMAYVKKIYGNNNGNYMKLFKKFIKED